MRLAWILAGVLACGGPRATPAPVAPPPPAVGSPRDHGWRLWRELTSSGVPAWERWFTADAVFGGSGSLAASATLAFRPPHDIKLAGRVVIPATQPQLSYVLLDDVAAAHVRSHDLHHRAGIRAASTSSIPAFPTDARAVKLIWYPVRATGVTAVPVWDDAPVHPDGDGNPPASWRRTVAVSLDGAGGTIPIDRFYHRALATVGERDAARVAWHDRTLELGDAVVLVAVHATTKEIPDWTWSTYWWHDRADDGPYAAGRPAAITGWAASYVMAATFDAAEPCANPWLEGRFPSGLASNCVSCHERAALGAAEFLPVTAGRTGSDDPYWSSKTSTDFMWSIALEAR